METTCGASGEVCVSHTWTGCCTCWRLRFLLWDEEGSAVATLGFRPFSCTPLGVQVPEHLVPPLHHLQRSLYERVEGSRLWVAWMGDLVHGSRVLAEGLGLYQNVGVGSNHRARRSLCTPIENTGTDSICRVPDQTHSCRCDGGIMEEGWVEVQDWE